MKIQVNKYIVPTLALSLIWVGGSILWSDESLPSISQVAATMLKMLSSSEFISDIFSSISRVLLAFSVAALIAIPLGILMSSIKSLNLVLWPVIEFIRYIPVPSLLPLFVLWTGIGEAPKFLVLFVGTFFQLVLLIKDDADNMPAQLYELGSTLKLNAARKLYQIKLPYLAPYIFERLRVTLGWCWTYLVIAELIATDKGIGRVIKEAERVEAYDRLFVCFIVLGIVGITTNYIMLKLYPKFFPYMRGQTIK